MTGRDEHKNQIFGVSYWSVICVILAAFPLVFVSNAEPRVTTMAYPDTGELIQNILAILSWENFYDQTKGSKTSLYGWAHSAVIFWQYVGLNKIFLLDKDQFYNIYALVARLSNFAITCSLAFFYPVFLAKFVQNRWIVFFGTISLVGIAAPGTSSVLIAVAFFSGVILMTNGMMGLYIARIYNEVKARPRYIIKDVILNENKEAR